VKFEIGHVLFIDIVGYSKLLITEQTVQLQTLKAVIRGSEQVRQAESEGKLLRLPTGDGAAVVFRNNREAPVLCAVEISQELKKHPELRVRMGVHSGPVNEVSDLNEQANMAGAGINIAQRVMDCGDAGHILLSKQVANDIDNYPQWRSSLHDLGECEVKHGTHIGIVNLYGDDIGNPEVPKKFRALRRRRAQLRWGLLAAGLLSLAAIVIAFLVLSRRPPRSIGAESEKSIAVLPFENQNRDLDTDYLCDGIPESIIHSLSGLPKLKVMSRNSVFHYKGKQTDAQTVAKELKVQSVLTGRVAQRGDALFIGVELINAEDNTEIWGQQYNRKLADVFAVQQEIAQEISEKLRSKLTGVERQQLAKRPTENLRAFQYYMQSRTFATRRTREDLLEAIRFCEKAIGEDRNYALAYAGLSEAYSNLGLRGYIEPSEGQRKAEDAATKALALDNNLAEGCATLGFAYTIFVPSDFSLGDRELRRSVELSPSLAIAHQYLGVSLLRQSRFDEGLEETIKARELDPLSSISVRLVALSWYLKRDYGRAIELLRQANELGPPFTTPFEIGIYIQNGLFDEALADLEKAKQKRRDDPILIYCTGLVYAAQGKRADALGMVKALAEMQGASVSQAHPIARIYAALNEKELALTWLEKGVAARAIGGFYKDEPMWDPIRSDRRFADLIHKMSVEEGTAE
jgi:TolB-like protein/Flp pilus assembly protein TadD